MIYNTLTTSREIQEFIKDGGKITVKYNHVSKVSDLYDVTNIVEIKCVFPSCEVNGYTACVTFMNKFFRFALFQVAMPISIKDVEGSISIEFAAKVDSWETRENEFKIIKELNIIVNKAKDMVGYFERRLEVLEARKVIFALLSDRKRITDKFINNIKNDNKMCEIFALDSIYFTWHDNNEIREQLKKERSSLLEYFHNATYDETFKYYTSNLNKYMQRIS